MKLRYTKEAIAKLAQVLGGLAEHSPHGARRVRSRIRTAIGLLTEHPYSGQRTSRPTVRRLVLVPYPYLIF
ncbi:type II toxin-antitoxin system RelE/ParE family toxin [Methylobacterium oryzisoli]|uniref:type II toxin-antitoxin system RelE/ParE family toxin n=1 Tax=Methylobacterium oryzisoli TaxID=3385502 RepID=UPI003892C631